MKKAWFPIITVLLLTAILVVNISKEFGNDEKSDLNPADYQDGASVAADTESNSERVKNSIGLEEGKTAPDFKLETLSGETVKLSDYRGQVVLINFWASWCPPCKAEMPHMEEFYKENKEKQFTILAVNLTNMDRGMDEIQSFVNDYGLTFPILLDQDGKTGTEYQAHAIPTSYIVDQKGVIIHKITGPMSKDMMNDMVSSLIKK